MWANNHFLASDTKPARVPAPEDEEDSNSTPKPAPEDQFVRGTELLEDVFVDPPQEAFAEEEGFQFQGYPTEYVFGGLLQSPIVNDEKTPISATEAMFGDILKRQSSSDAIRASAEDVYGSSTPRQIFNLPARPKKIEADDEDQWQDKPKNMNSCSTNLGLERFVQTPRRVSVARDPLAGYRVEDYNITTTKGSIMRGELILPAVLSSELRGATITLLAEGSLEYFPWPLSDSETTLLMEKAEIILEWQADVFDDWEAAAADKRYQAQWLALGTDCISPHHPDFRSKVHEWLSDFSITPDLLDRYRATYEERAGGLRPNVHGEHTLYEGLDHMASNGRKINCNVSALFHTCEQNLEAAMLDKGRCSDPLGHPEMLLRNRYIREEEEKRLAPPASPPPIIQRPWSGHGHPDDVYFGEANRKLFWDENYFDKL